jgi:hypothetical protein
MVHQPWTTIPRGMINGDGTVGGIGADHRGHWQMDGEVNAKGEASGVSGRRANSQSDGVLFNLQ